MKDLIQEIKEFLIECLELEDVLPEDIEDGGMLFGDGLGLDSIDALELGIAIHNKYNVKLEANSEETKKHFQSVKSLAKLIESSRNI